MGIISHLTGSILPSPTPTLGTLTQSSRPSSRSSHHWSFCSPPTPTFFKWPFLCHITPYAWDSNYLLTHLVPAWTWWFWVLGALPGYPRVHSRNPESNTLLSEIMQKHHMWIRTVSSKENSTRAISPRVRWMESREILNLSCEEGGGLDDRWGAWKGRVMGEGIWLVDCMPHGTVRSSCAGGNRTPKTNIQRVAIGNDSRGVIYREAVGGILSKGWVSKDKNEEHAWTVPSPVLFPRSAAFYWTRRVKSLVFINIGLH